MVMPTLEIAKKQKRLVKKNMVMSFTIIEKKQSKLALKILE